MSDKIFINYRRDDSIGMAGRLHDRLAQTFGRDRLFMDVDHIPVGADFVAHLNSQVAACEVVLVVIGRNWLRAKDKAGQRRLHQPDDFVAIEIAAALARDIRVIPVLVDGVRMPKESELPDSLKPLARRQAVDVRHSHFGHDAEALVKRMREALGEEVPVAREREALGEEVPVAREREALGDEKAGPSRWRVRAAIGVAAVAVMLLIVWGWRVNTQHMLTTVEQTVQQREVELKAEWERQAKAAAEAEEKRKAEEAERQRLAAVKAEQERQARAEEKRKAELAEQQRIAALKAEQERQARAAAEAEAKRKAELAEQQRVAALKAEQERQARAAAEAEAKRKAELAEQQQVAALKAEQERQAKAAAEAQEKRKAEEAERQRRFAPTGFSLLDKTNPLQSGQDQNLKPHSTPPVAAALDKLPLDKIKLPAGFKAELYSSGHPAGRTMVMGNKGTLFMGTRLIGRVYAITNKYGKREAKVLLQGLTQPNGLAFKDGSLYVFAINKVFRFDNIEDNLDKPGTGVELTEAFGLPDTIHHNWKYVDFGPDGKMYVQVGANCNICEVNPDIHGQIRRYNADGTGMEIIARGVRNTVGFDWHPVTKELWFTDNGRDWAGDEGPEDELNRVAKGNEGANFGFPYCHANGVADPDVKKPNPCAGVTLPAALLGPHAGALGIKFYNSSMFPKSYQNVAFVVRRGSWNRSQKFGYDVAVARIADGRVKIEPFLTGLLDEKANTFYGRPTYVLPVQDGSLLVSDEQNGAVYRITYGSPKTARP